MNREASPSPTSANPDAEFIPIYTSANFAEVEIITDMFEDEQIGYMIRRREMAAFPTTIGEHDQIRVFVEPAGVYQGRQLIEQALVDEAIPGDGNFLDTIARDKIEKARRGAVKQAERAREEAKEAQRRAEQLEQNAREQGDDREEARKQRHRAERERQLAARCEQRAEMLAKQAQVLEARAEAPQSDADG